MNAHRRSPEAECIRVVDRSHRREANRAHLNRITAWGREAALAIILPVAANDRVAHMEGMLDAIREQLTAATDAPGASSIMAAAAYQPMVDLKRAIANAEAQRVFGREGRS